MALTTYLAELFGLYIALMGVVMIVKTKAMRELMAAFVDHRALITFLRGFVFSSAWLSS
jgi:hypothetical protein